MPWPGPGRAGCRRAGRRYRPGPGGRRPPPAHSRCCGPGVRPAGRGWRRRPRRRHPRCRDVGVQRAAEHGLGQGRLGRKPDLVGDAGGPQAVGVIDPALGRYSSRSTTAWPGAAGVHQVDGDLGVLDPPGGAGVLAPHGNGRRPLLEVAGLADHQDRLGVAEVLDRIVARVVADPPWSQTARASRCCIPSGWGRWRARRSSSSSCAAGPQAARARTPWHVGVAHPSKPTRDPAHHLVEQLLPPGRFHGYAVACGHCLIFGCPHHTGSSTVAALAARRA
jgi:hypothetical protein